MTTPLDKILKREIKIDGRTFIVAVSPDGLKLTLKGKRRGQELRWSDLISGEAALATALNASLGQFAAANKPANATANDSVNARKKSSAGKPASRGKPAPRRKPARSR